MAQRDTEHEAERQERIFGGIARFRTEVSNCATLLHPTTSRFLVLNTDTQLCVVVSAIARHARTHRGIWEVRGQHTGAKF